MTHGREIYIRGERGFKLLAILLVLLGSIEVITILLSLTRVVIAQGIAIAIVLGAFLLAAGYGFILRSEWSGKISGDGRSSGWPVRFVVVAAILVYVRLWVIAYAIPDCSWDGLYYHISTMHFWAIKGYVHWIETGPSIFYLPIKVLWNGFPKGVELMGFILVRATGLSRLLNAVNLTFLPLGVLAIYCLSRFLGASLFWGSLAGALFIFIPINISLSATTYVDTSVASCYIALFALVLFVLHKIKAGVLPWKFLPALGCGLGLSWAAKAPAIVLLPVVVVLLMLRIYWVGRRMTSPDHAQSNNLPEVKPHPLPALRILGKGGVFILLLLVIALLVGGYWSVRNLIHTGNPIYPANLKIAGWTIFAGDQALFTPPQVPGMEDWSQIKRVMFNWLEGWENWRGAATSYSSWYGGLGLLWILGGVPSIIFLLILTGREYKFRRRVWSGFSPGSWGGLLPLAVMVLILFFAMPKGHSHIIRYTIWLYGIGLPCFVVVAGRVWSARTSLIRWGGRLWVVICVIAIVLEGMYSLQYKTGGVARIFDLSRIIRSLGQKYPVGYYWGGLRGTIFESILSDQEAVALGALRGRRKLILGHLAQGDAFGKRSIYFLDQQTIESAIKLRSFLRKRNIKYLIWDIEEPIPTILKDSAVLKEESGGLFQVLVYIPALLPE